MVSFVSILFAALPSFAKTQDYPYYSLLSCSFTLSDGHNTGKHRIKIFVQDPRGGRAMVGMSGRDLYPSSLTYVQTLERHLDTPVSFDLRIGGTGNDQWQSEAFFELQPAKKVKGKIVRKGKLTMKTNEGEELKSDNVVCRQE